MFEQDACLLFFSLPLISFCKLKIIQHDPLHIDALCKTSELYNIIGKRRPTKEEQKQYYKTGESYARKALKVNPNHSEANFAMAISMGRMALISSGKDKVAAVKEIKTYADKCIQLDGKNFKGYHVLGKWHYEVSDLNSFERWIVKITYGALPPSSLDEAIKNYEKSKASMYDEMNDSEVKINGSVTPFVFFIAERKQRNCARLSKKSSLWRGKRRF